MSKASKTRWRKRWKKEKSYWYLWERQHGKLSKDYKEYQEPPLTLDYAMKAVRER